MKRPDETFVPHIWEKLGRADKHIEELEGLVAEYVSDPARMVANPDADGFNKFLRDHEGRAAPQIFSVIAGEVFYQLRSSLDHLVCALVYYDRGTPNHQTQFPIFEDEPRKNRERYEGQIHGITRKNVRNFIESLQPHRTKDTQGVRLIAIRDKCNRDKHRHIDIQTTNVAGSITFHILGKLELDTAKRKDGKTQQTITLPLAQKKADVSLRTSVVFKEWLKPTQTAVEVVPALKDLSAFVRGIIALGENYLRPKPAASS